MNCEWKNVKNSPPLFGQVVLLAIGLGHSNLILANRVSSNLYKEILVSWDVNKSPMVLDANKEESVFWLPIPYLNLDNIDET